MSDEKGGFSEIYTAEWINGCYNEWDSKEQRLNRIGESGLIQTVVLKKLENVENANRSWLEEAKSHLNISNKPDIETLRKRIRELNFYYQDKPNELLTKLEEDNSLEIGDLENYTNSSRLFTSKVHQFENLPEPRNSTEEELEAFYSKSFNFYVPDNIDDFGKSVNQSDNDTLINKDNSKSLSEVPNKLQINSKSDVQNNYYREEIMQQQRKNIDIDEDEVHNNPNLHSEEQDELEIPDNI
ncbi:kinase-like domain-containing protein [Rhizophagus irregularis DAOM 181602=DAOM 197198]|nr:kinase-like domain-containing protein [Rhizophagus irregularis DAOM 181602=DAOM 197198]